MKTLIGMFLIYMAIAMLIIFIFGYDFNLKEKIYMIIGWAVFLALLLSGAYLITAVRINIIYYLLITVANIMDIH